MAWSCALHRPRRRSKSLASGDIDDGSETLTVLGRKAARRELEALAEARRDEVADTVLTERREFPPCVKRWVR